MGKREKQIEKFRQNPKNVRYEEIENLLLSLGFKLRRSAGSHAVFTYPGKYPITIPVKNPFLKPEYVKKVINILDEFDIEIDD